MLAQSCGYDGNADLYGLGIRLAFYLQWTSSWIIDRWYLQERRNLHETYTVFVLALMITIVVITAQNQPIFAADLIILSYIIFGGTFTAFTIQTRKRSRSMKTETSEISFIVLVTVVVVMTAALIYYAWFWLYGARRYFSATPCGTFFFLFGKISWETRPAAVILSVISIIFALFFAENLVFLIGMRFTKERNGSHPTMNEINTTARSGSFGSARSHQEAAERKFTERFFQDYLAMSEDLGTRITAFFEPGSRRKLSRGKNRQIDFLAVLSLYNVLIPIYSILGVELCIYWNNVRGVAAINTTGQLIPFVIGVVGFGKTVYAPLNERRNRKTGVSTSDSRVSQEMKGKIVEYALTNPGRVLSSSPLKQEHTEVLLSSLKRIQQLKKDLIDAMRWLSPIDLALSIFR